MFEFKNKKYTTEPDPYNSQCRDCDLHTPCESNPPGIDPVVCLWNKTIYKLVEEFPARQYTLDEITEYTKATFSNEIGKVYIEGLVEYFS